MYKPFLFFLFIAAVLFGIAQQQPGDKGATLMSRYLAAEKNYSDAERLSAQAGDNEKLQQKADALYQRSLSQFKSLLPDAGGPGNDSILFLAHNRAAYIEYLFDSVQLAKQDYLAALHIYEQTKKIPDSLLFSPLLFTGGIFYSLDQFDSAMHFFQRAETLAGSLEKKPKEIQRLYNRLGVLYYETGNYRQAKFYFEMAVASTPASDVSLLANYRINIASLLVKLDELEQAKSIYESLLPQKLFTNEIFHNLGIISLKQNDPAGAINYLRKVHYENDKKSIDLYYNMAMAMAGMKERDSLDKYLLKAHAEVIRWYGNKKSIANGLLYKFEGDQYTERKQPAKAIEFYRDAIQQFVPYFNEISVTTNPEDFLPVHSYINLFNTLVAKADAFQMLFDIKKEQADLQNALAAYRAAFQLADHVERTYNSDEARLFLEKIKYSVHNRPIEIGLHLFQLTRKKEFLEDVYSFDQQNKASILSLSRWEKKLRSSQPALNALYLREESLKSEITRLSLRLGQDLDSSSTANLNSLIRGKEIELNNVQESIKSSAGKTGVVTRGQVPSVPELQARLDNRTVILSYHLSDQAVVILLISGNKFEYKYVPIDSVFFKNIQSFRNSLYNASPGARYEGHRAANYLYQKLIRPLSTELAQLKRLIVIPDDELNYLPFEALEDDHGNYLLQLFSIQYQYASSLIGVEKRSAPMGSILSFAPFSSRSYTDSGGKTFSVLPWSASETSGQQGLLLKDSLATKSSFLTLASHYSIIHLATHAAADNRDPMRSYIGFYPNDKDPDLFAREIYDLDLDSTNLIVLSACETAEGKLQKGEGLLSLSRAFAYAGCPNIIASLWKAEDKTTAYLSERLYYYLSRDYKKDEALQQAKVDLLNNAGIEGRYKTPNYWAHLILIGEYEPHHKRKQWSGVAVGILVLLLGYIAIKRAKARLK